MKVGTLAYDTLQGLGVLARSFFDAGVVTDMFVVRHSSRRSEFDYPGAPVCNPRDPDFRKLIQEFCRSVDIMLFFETPFDWDLFDYCGKVGVKTAIMPMYECMPKDFPDRYQPDLILNPSYLDQSYYPKGVRVVVPVTVPWKERTEARRFVHNAGHGGLLGRNGTRELLEAMRYVTSPIQLTVRFQSRPSWYDEVYSQVRGDSRVQFEFGDVPADKLYDGDVFVFPEKFNGLSLPLQEALASGMVVCATDRIPNNIYLQQAPLIPVKTYRRNSVSGRCVEFQEAVIDPLDLARAIDAVHNFAPWKVEMMSAYGEEWAKENTWAVWKPIYTRELERLVRK